MNSTKNLSSESSHSDHALHFSSCEYYLSKPRPPQMLPSNLIRYVSSTDLETVIIPPQIVEPVPPDTSYVTRKRIVLLGSTNSGKTALVTRLVDQFFPAEFDFTLGDTFVWNTVVDEEPHEVMILDSAGEDELNYRSLLVGLFLDVDAVLLLFSIQDLATFKILKNIYPILLGVLCIQQEDRVKELVCMVVGTHADCELERKVDIEMAQKFVADNDMEYWETSAWSGWNVTETFQQVVRLIHERVREANKGAIPEAWKHYGMNPDLEGSESKMNEEGDLEVSLAMATKFTNEKTSCLVM